MTSALATLLLAAAPLLAPGGALVGDAANLQRQHLTSGGESLIELAQDQDLGYGEIVAANPRLDPYVPGDGAPVTLPAAWILPSAARPGTLVVNVAEQRLYWWPRGGGPISFPVGVGVPAHPTPLGTFRVVQKEVRPTWHPTAGARHDDPELPAAVPPGPDNPLGDHALRLTGGLILLHGTNQPFGVGRAVSRGCMRLYPEDVARLHQLVPVGAEVVILREPVKVMEDAGRVLVEVHGGPDGSSEARLLALARRALGRRRLLARADPAALARAVRERRGLVVDVTQR